MSKRMLNLRNLCDPKKRVPVTPFSEEQDDFLPDELRDQKPTAFLRTPSFATPTLPDIRRRKSESPRKQPSPVTPLPPFVQLEALNCGGIFVSLHWVHSLIKILLKLFILHGYIINKTKIRYPLIVCDESVQLG
jgi:hypothetical protein